MPVVLLFPSKLFNGRFKLLTQVSYFFGMKMYKHLDFKSLVFFVRHYRCSA